MFVFASIEILYTKTSQKERGKKMTGEIFFFYPFHVFFSIRSMTGNIKRLNLNNTWQVAGKSTSSVVKKSGTDPNITGTLTDNIQCPEPRDLFLCDLQPVKMHLFNFIRKSMNYGADADDLFQETLLKGFRYFYSFDRQQSFKTWIFTIAHNLIKSYYTGNNETTRGARSFEEIDDITISVENAVMAGQVREIYRVAANLKPRQREVFFLYYYNEFSVAEIAGICGLSRPGVKFILHQARTVIKKVVEVQ
jgi:RNA polymerase sigma-70 factor, ECF subfamily